MGSIFWLICGNENVTQIVGFRFPPRDDGSSGGGEFHLGISTSGQKAQKSLVVIEFRVQ